MSAKQNEGFGFPDSLQFDYVPHLNPGFVHGAQVHQEGPVILIQEHVGGLQVSGGWSEERFGCQVSFRVKGQTWIV